MAEGKENPKGKPKVLSSKQVETEQKWNHLSTLLATDAKKHGYFESSEVKFHTKKGSLVVIGSGIKSVGHFTLEALSHIKTAHKVLYWVADPTTEVYIRDLRPDALDLCVFYADDKKYYHTYIQMSEACLYFARRGLNVVCIFYGHPAIFVLPSHRAIQIARQQGIKAYMLPAVSAEDCLFADLGIDPSYPGLQILEATDMLLRRRKLLTDFHVIIACVGDLVFSRQGHLNHNYRVLIEHLQSQYGENYTITHYIGAQFPICSPLIEHHPLSEFLETEVAKRITGISTFYIPPKEVHEVDPKMAVTLGLVPTEKEATNFPNNTVCPVAEYGPQEIKAIEQLEQWTVPYEYAHTSPTKAARYIGSLATNIKLLRRHMKEPEQSMKEFQLGAHEIAALQSNHSGRIRITLKASTDDVAKQVVIRMVTNPAFASEFAREARKIEADKNGIGAIEEWLSMQGYDTTLDAMSSARSELQESSLLMWSGLYPSTIANATFQIQGESPPSTGEVWAAGVLVKKPTFSNYTLSWSSSDGNSHSASLVFNTNGKHILSFTGRFWKAGDPEPISDNIQGQNGPFKSSLANWVGRYKTTLQKVAGPEVVVAIAVSSSTTTSEPSLSIKVGRKAISCFTYASNKKLLAWNDRNNATNANFTFFERESVGINTFHFSGKYWVKDTTPPEEDNFSGSMDGGSPWTTQDKGNTLAMGLLTMRLVEAVKFLGVAILTYFKNPTPENKEEMEQAQREAEEIGEEQTAVENSITEGYLPLDPVEPSPGQPSVTTNTTQTTETETTYSAED